MSSSPAVARRPRSAPETVYDKLAWLGSIAETRLTGTAEERLVQDEIAARVASLGYSVELPGFRYPRHIYGSVALHFGLALTFAAVGASVPYAAGPVAFAILFVGWSFVSEIAFRRPLLRRLWPTVASQNLVATLPATRALRRRIVLLAHVDSAFTGWLFHPPILRLVAGPPPRVLAFLQKQLRLPTLSAIALAIYFAVGAFVALPWWPVAILAIPAVIVFVLNAQIVLNDRPVSGAADNLTGCAAMLELAEAWADRPVDDVEVVFAWTGCEEAGAGGATHLASSMKAEWDPAITEVLVLDTLSNGELFSLEEGELFRIPQPTSLLETLDRAASDLGVATPPSYIIPAGATDAAPFLAEGYRALAITCIDPALHAPRHYHHPTDTVDNVDPEQLERSTELATAWLYATASA
ncbi:MAG: M28 family metallopeptidase [Sandaracinaceae bacterium]